MMNYLFLLMLIISPSTQSDSLFVASDSLFDNSGIIDLGSLDGWRFHEGDDLNWANPGFDDSSWIIYNPLPWNDPIPDSLWQGYGWFRYRFALDSSAYAKVTNLYFVTYAAAEVYLDGKLVKKYGTFSANRQGEKYYMPYYKTHPAIVIRPGESHVLAVRFSYHKGKEYKKLLGKNTVGFGFVIGLTTDYLNQKITTTSIFQRQFLYIPASMLLVIVLLHGFLFALFPSEKSNLFIAIIAFLLCLHIVITWIHMFFELDDLQFRLFQNIPFILIFTAAISMFPFTINLMFNNKPRLIHKIIIWLFPVVTLANFIFSGPNPNPLIIGVFAMIIIFFSSQILIKALNKNEKGVWYVAGGFLGLIVSTVTFILYREFAQNLRPLINNVLSYMIYLSFPLGITAFMASRFRDLYFNLEQKVAERTSELKKSLEDLKSAEAQLIQSEKMASLGQLTAGIAHEIQNPLNFVNNFSEVNQELIVELKEELAEGSRQLAAGSRQSVEEKLKSAEEIANDIHENEQKISHHGKRAESIVKGMLLHSRGNSGHKELVDINALCDEYLRLSYHGFRAKDKLFNAEFKLEADKSLPKIEVVPQDIGRVLLNLINNAFYAVDKKAKSNTPNNYMPAVTICTVSTKSPSGDLGVKISIKDNGDGIPSSIVDKIFQPFFTTKPAGQGTGLGLSLAYDIVKAHGGEIKVVTKEGVGTEFIIQIPV